MVVHQWVRKLQATEGELLTDTEQWKALLEFANAGENLESIVSVFPGCFSQSIDVAKHLLENRRLNIYRCLHYI